MKIFRLLFANKYFIDYGDGNMTEIEESTFKSLKINISNFHIESFTVLKINPWSDYEIYKLSTEEIDTRYEEYINTEIFAIYMKVFKNKELNWSKFHSKYRNIMNMDLGKDLFGIDILHQITSKYLDFDVYSE